MIESSVSTPDDDPLDLSNTLISGVGSGDGDVDINGVRKTEGMTRVPDRGRDGWRIPSHFEPSKGKQQDRQDKTSVISGDSSHLSDGDARESTGKEISVDESTKQLVRASQA